MEVLWAHLFFVYAIWMLIYPHYWCFMVMNTSYNYSYNADSFASLLFYLWPIQCTINKKNQHFIELNLKILKN